MNTLEEKLAARFSNSQEVLRVTQKAVSEALLDHKRTGDPIAVWRDGQVVMVPADEIVVPAEVSAPELNDMPHRLPK